MDKTAASPPLNYYGKLEVHHQVIVDLVNYYLKNENGLYRIKNIKVFKEQGMVKITLNLEIKYGIAIHKYLQELQLGLKKFVEMQTGLTVTTIAVEVNSLFVS